MDQAEELRDWLRLTRATGVGREACRRLLQACGSPRAVLEAPFATWQAAAGRAAAEGLAQRDATDARADAQWQASLRWLDADRERRHVLAWGDPAYPARLLESPDPPPLLWLEGESWRLSEPSVAVVGSRQATPGGLATARSLSAALSQQGLLVVSGLASGIDGAAHDGALDGPGGTLAVTGCGLDTVYPARHRALAARILANGALLSEHPPGTPPLAAHFPQRNRIIAGLSLGTLVVEAALRSGSLITARLALEANREVFAVPGSIHAPQSAGCLQLIRQGAVLVSCIEDLLAELPPGRWQAAPSPAAPAAAPGPTGDEARLLGAMGADPVGLDTLSARSGWSAAELSARLLGLELSGQVARLPGGRFQRIARA